MSNRLIDGHKNFSHPLITDVIDLSLIALISHRYHRVAANDIILPNILRSNMKKTENILNVT